MTRPSMGTPQGLPMGIPITGRLPLQPPVSVGHNPLLMQQVMQGNLSQTTVRGKWCHVFLGQRLKIFVTHPRNVMIIENFEDQLEDVNYIIHVIII